MTRIDPRLPHTVIITTCLYTFRRPHTCGSAKPQVWSPGGERGCSCHPSVITQSPLAASEFVSRGQSGHVWFQPCILTHGEESPLWTWEECVPDCLHSVYGCTICFRCHCSGMHNDYPRGCTIIRPSTAWLDECTHVFPTYKIIFLYCAIVQINKFYLHYKPALHLWGEAKCVGGKHMPTRQIVDRENKSLSGERGHELHSVCDTPRYWCPGLSLILLSQILIALNLLIPSGIYTILSFFVMWPS